MRPINRKGQQGVYVALFAILAVVLVALVSLIVTSAYLTRNQTRTQALADLTALAAIERFSRPSNVAQRITESENRVNQLLERNTLLGGSTNLGSADRNLQFGTYCPKPGPAGYSFGDLCYEHCTEYPCFEEVANTTSQTEIDKINAIQVEIGTNSVSSFSAPLQSFITGGELTSKAASIATIVPRCTAYLVDVSGSSAFETHRAARFMPVAAPVDPRRRYRFIDPVLQQPDPNGIQQIRTGFFAYDASGPGGIYSGSTFDPTEVYSPISGFCQCGVEATFSSAQCYAFCNSVRFDNQDDLNVDWNRTTDLNPSSQLRYRTDYRLHPSFKGLASLDRWVAIDAFTNPEPLSRFLLAFNASLREIQRFSAKSDRAVAIAFSGDIVDRIPAGTDLTEDLDYLMQITNIENRGTITSTGAVRTPRISPNAVDRGWFPFFRNPDGTNLVSALTQAITALSRCSPLDRKSIIIATDGVGNCRFNGQFDLNLARTDFKAGNSTTTQCNDLDVFFNDQRSQLLDVILPVLRAKRITVTTLLDGDYVIPHFLNTCKVPDPDPTKCIEFLDPSEAAAYKTGTWESFYFNSAMKCPSGSCAKTAVIQNLGRPGFALPEVNAVMGQLSFESGGVFCPLFNPCTAADIQAQNGGGLPAGCSAPFYTDHDGNPATAKRLKDVCRRKGAMQTCGVYELTKAEQAIDCALNTLGRNPFALATLQDNGGIAP